MSKYSVLCLDNESEILQIMADYLTEAGFHPLLATRPAEALRLLESNSHNIVLMICDFQMPEMDGIQFCKEIIQKWEIIPLIICSSHSSSVHSLNAVDLKVSSYIQKPIRRDVFKQLIQKQAQERIDQLEEDFELRAGFLNEAELLLEELEPLLLSLDKSDPEIETMNRIFAIVHTIKGTSAFFEPDIISKYTHKYEDFFTPYKLKEVPFTADTIEILLKGADKIKVLLDAFKNHSACQLRLEDFTCIFNHTAQAVEKNTENENGKPVKTSPTESKPREDVRVSLDLLDEFMELSGEITVIRNMINKLVKTIEDEQGTNKNITHLSNLLHEMNKINGTLQDKVVDIRKVPLKNLFRPLNRTIRDLAKDLNKEIDIEFINESLRVDTSLAEILSSSLIHMVRNSADHGIENPGERINAGKDAQGKIQIIGKQISNEIVIEISDNGKGLDTDFLRKKVIEKKLRSEDEVSKMSTEEIQSMIFESGFSTANQVTDVSGRGVGMDMVKKSIVKVGGKIKIESQKGLGTKFSLHLPIPKSVMIIGSILVQVKDEVCAIPQDSILRLVNLSENHQGMAIRHMEGADCLLIDGNLIPLVELSKLFDQDPVIQASSRLMSTDKGKIVIVKANSLVYGILVDEILDLEDTVVKKLGKSFANQKQFLGATFLADTLVGLIIDTIGVASLMGLNTEQAPRIIEKKGEEITSEENRSILLFKLESDDIIGMELNEIFRLEQINPEQIQISGESRTCLYRNTIMPLHCMNSLLNYSGANILDQHQKNISTLVFKDNNHFIGVCISSIEDLTQSSSVVDPSIRDRFGIKGAAIIDGRTVTMIDSNGIIELAKKIHQFKTSDLNEKMSA
jgi:two-component system, chemotaxis family, sensor kinase CheA